MSEKEALVKNASDAKQIQAAGSKAKMRQEALKERIKAQLSTRMGRRYVWDILDFCGIYDTTFRHDTHQTAFAEGARMVGLKLLKELRDVDLDLEHVMIKEAREDLERGF